MPLKLNIGVSKKLGLPHYGSLGALCHVEVELDSSLLQSDLDGFHRQVRNAYAACRQAVNEELARSQTPRSAPSTGSPPEASAAETSAAEAGSPVVVNGDVTNGHPTQGNHRLGNRASQKQLDYASQLAGQIAGLGLRRLESLAQTKFGLPLAGLSNLEASSLIDTLKEIKAGNVELTTALPGGSP